MEAFIGLCKGLRYIGAREDVTRLCYGLQIYNRAMEEVRFLCLSIRYEDEGRS